MTAISRALRLAGFAVAGAIVLTVAFAFILVAALMGCLVWAATYRDRRELRLRMQEKRLRREARRAEAGAAAVTIDGELAGRR